MKKINILRILFIGILGIITIFALMKPSKVETNLLRAFFSNSAKDELLINLSGKYSSNINLLIESENSSSVEKTKKDILDKIDKESFEIQSTDINKTLEYYKQYKNNLLSYKDYTELKKGNFDTIAEQAVGNILNPFGFSLLPMEEDPFMLFTNYILSLGNGGMINSINGKYYDIINLKVEENLALSPNLMNEEVKKLIEIQNSFTDEKTKVYLTGTPVHSYYASAKSIKEINLMCIISTLFVGGLVLWYFRSLKILIPILMSLAIGMGMGYCVSTLLFKSIHIFTFVFSTTLIGICVDYSLHYLMECDVKKVFKSLTVSMLSTVFAIFILSLSGIELLKQIAVFTSAGLITVYFIVILFYELLPPQKSKHKFNLKVHKIILPLILLIIIGGMFKIRFNDDIRTMYTPSAKMLQAEQLYREIAGINQNTSFIMTEGNSLEEILQIEETVSIKLNENNISYYSLSKFLPSVKRQNENIQLHKTLYNKKLTTFKELLSASDIKNLNNFDIAQYLGENAFSEISQLNDFMLDKNHSLMLLYDFKTPEMLNGLNNIHYINLPLEISDGIKNVRVTCLKILCPIFILLYVLLGIIFSFKNAHKIILPSIISSLFSISFISLFQPINLFHILAVFLITGFGLDYSVFRFNGSKNSYDAVLISCITTVFSFGLLALTSFKLISSLGFVLALGLLSSYILSILLISKDSELTIDNINSSNNLKEQ